MKNFYKHWRDFPKDALNNRGAFRKWPNFSPEEMACRGTGSLVLDDRAMTCLQNLRSRIDRPFIVNSAYRSPAHNRRVGGAKKSKHLEAIAFDISMSNHDPIGFEIEAKKCGFRGIGHYAPKNGAYNFMHIDTRDHDARWSGGGGFFVADSETRFTPEPVAKPAKEAARDVVVGAGSAAVVTSGLREVSPYLPDPLGNYAMIAAIVIPLIVAGVFAAYRFFGKRSSEPGEES